jgi:hypothetical protein
VCYVEDHAERNVPTTRKLREEQAAERWRLLQLWMAGIVLPWGGSSWVAMKWDWFHRWQLGRIKNIADYSLTCKSYWAQWRSLAVRDGMLVCHLKLTKIDLNGSDRPSLESVEGITGQAPWRICGRTPKCWQDPELVRQLHCWIYRRSDIGRWCWQGDAFAARWGRWFKYRGLTYQYDGAPFERTATDIAGTSP